MSGKSHRHIEKLGSLVTFKTGKLDSNAAVPNGSYPFFTCSQETLYTNTYSFDDECVLLAGNNANGIFPLKYFHGKFDAYQRTYIVRSRDSSVLLTKYLYFALRPKLVELRSVSTGAATKFLTLTILNETQIQIPSITEQQRIASILGAYDDLIEVNRRRVALLEEMARGLFEEWFVHFRFPGHEAVPILNAIDGPLPDGWKWLPFSSLAKFTNGYAFKPSHFGGDGLPIVKIPELKNGVSAKTPRYSGLDVPSSLHIKSGDLLFSWSGTLAISEWTGGNALLNQHLFLVTPTRALGRGFIKRALIAALPRFENQGVGATMKHIRRSALDDTYAAIPTDDALIQRGNAFLQGCYDEAVILKEQNDRLTASRDLLLPRLISGQLSVATAERELEQAA